MRTLGVRGTGGRVRLKQMVHFEDWILLVV